MIVHEQYFLVLASITLLSCVDSNSQHEDAGPFCAMSSFENCDSERCDLVNGIPCDSSGCSIGSLPIACIAADREGSTGGFCAQSPDGPLFLVDGVDIHELVRAGWVNLGLPIGGRCAH